MKPIARLKNWSFVIAVAAMAANTIHAQTVNHSYTLNPGWNSIWVELDPNDRDPEAVFTGIPVESVWSFQRRLASVNFIQNPNEPVWNRDEWLVHFPSGTDAALNNNLFAILPQRAYLVKYTGASPTTLTIQGTPVLRDAEWSPNAYNLRGLPVADSGPPTFFEFFKYSPAHYDSNTGQLQPIYRLNTGGQWVQVSPTDNAKRGEAVWAFAEGASDYPGPIAVSLDLDTALDFSDIATELSVSLKNRTGLPMTASVRDLGGGAGVLAYSVFDPDLGAQWPDFPGTLNINPDESGLEERVRLAVRRGAMTGDSFGTVLEISDGMGTRQLVAVKANKPGRSGASLNGPAEEAAERAGLWVGTASVNAVSEAHSDNVFTATPVRSEFNLRLIVHVDQNGNAKLLKEVIQMWQDGTFAQDGNGDLVVDEPGRYVLLTDDALIPLFAGAAQRDGTPVGRRISSVGFDFPASNDANFLPLDGFFTIGQSISGTILQPVDYATNPFKHKYHPDHDNLNARFDGPKDEAFATTRQISLRFSGSPPEGASPGPDFGYDEMAGDYSEIITGLHKNPIFVEGNFRLSRVSTISDLNPSPTP